MEKKEKPTPEIDLINNFFSSHGFKNVYDFMSLATIGNIVITDLNKDIPDTWFYDNLIGFFGNEYQIKKSLEEISELMILLTKSLTKTEIDPKLLQKEITTEMAHVLMTFESLKIAFKINENDLKNEIKFKKNILMDKYPNLKGPF